MKKIILFAAFSVMMMPYEALAQRYYDQGYPFEKAHLYAGLVATLPLGGGFSGTFFHPSGYGASFSYIAFSPNATNIPSNYDPGSNLFNWFGSFSINPKDHIQCYALHAIKEFPTDGNRIRLGIETGPSFLKFDLAENFTPVADPCPTIFGCDPNYTYQEKSYQAVGFSVKGKFEWTIAQPFGLEFIAQANLNKIRSFIAAGLVVDFGIVREEDSY
ncbi:MAG: hypothetical protein JNJ57_21510 [Saprospiraceae bacterium]|nr:hypothetical protein [Saprospiraceae bacterium]